MSMLVYDIEIKKAIQGRGEPKLHGIDYCAGWHDHKEMGVSVVCAYDYLDERYRVFCGDNMREFKTLCDNRDILVSFNGIGFDNRVLRFAGVELDDNKCYDILAEVWAAAGLSREYSGASHQGYSLGDLCEANFHIGKTGNGAMAPVQWQKGEIGSVIDYCLHDVRMTVMLHNHIIRAGSLFSPKDKRLLKVVRPV